MIARTDIGPDFEVLKKYLNGGISLDGLKGIFYNHFEKHNPEFNQSEFERILREHNLFEHLSNLYVFAWYYSDTLQSYQDTEKDYEKPHPSIQYNDDVKSLALFLCQDNCEEIKFISKKDRITISSSELIFDIKKLIRAYIEQTEQLNEPTKSLKEIFPRKLSIYKVFTESLSYLFHYLRNETYFKDQSYSNNQVYNFLYDLCSILGFDMLPDELKKYIK